MRSTTARDVRDSDSVQETNGGEGGIRTHGGLATSPHFECGALDHYATSPSGDYGRSKLIAARAAQPASPGVWGLGFASVHSVTRNPELSSRPRS